MYRRILVPVDGSNTSQLGLLEAIGLAKEQSARLRLINVVDERVFLQSGAPFPIANTSEAIRSLEQAGAKALDEGEALARKARVRVERSILRSGGRHVSSVILEDAKRWRADLIVMGTHGWRGVYRMLLGSDAEGVLREAPVPLLLVRGDPAKKPRRKKPRA